MLRFIKLFYSTFCGALIFVFIWSLVWFIILRPIFRFEDGFFAFLIFAAIAFILGGYIGHSLAYTQSKIKISAEKRKIYSIINFSLGILLLSPFVYLLWSMFAFSLLITAPCDNKQNTRIMSSHEFYATYYTRNCGATTYFSEHILVDNTEVLSAQIRTNIRPPLKIEWLDYNTLFVSLASSSISDIKVFRKKESTYTPFNGSVTIKYSDAINNAKSSGD